MRIHRPKRGSAAQRAAAVYQGTLEAVFAVLIAMGIGYWADRHFGTSPRWLVVGAAVGFASFVLRLLRMRSLVEEAGRAAGSNGPGTGDPGEDRKEGDEGGG